MDDLLEGLSVLRCSALELAQICNDNSKSTSRLRALTDPSPTISNPTPTRDIWSPPPPPPPPPTTYHLINNLLFYLFS
ncbi:hypothetical protein EDC94DRAFT_569124 [Helicostylum pulchrum]|nr:hypothetical protein EDC94DRAFT_569124 [Helicostylum pulchrum]